MGIKQVVKEIIFIAFFLKDPCDKCLVKPCCSSCCSEKYKVNIITSPYESIKTKKIQAWTLLLSIIYSLIVIIYLIVDITTTVKVVR